MSRSSSTACDDSARGLRCKGVRVVSTSGAIEQGLRSTRGASLDGRPSCVSISQLSSSACRMSRRHSHRALYSRTISRRQDHRAWQVEVASRRHDHRACIAAIERRSSRCHDHRARRAAGTRLDFTIIERLGQGSLGTGLDVTIIELGWSFQILMSQPSSSSRSASRPPSGDRLDIANGSRALRSPWCGDWMGSNSIGLDVTTIELSLSCMSTSRLHNDRATNAVCTAPLGRLSVLCWFSGPGSRRYNNRARPSNGSRRHNPIEPEFATHYSEQYQRSYVVETHGQRVATVSTLQPLSLALSRRHELTIIRRATFTVALLNCQRTRPPLFIRQYHLANDPFCPSFLTPFSSPSANVSPDRPRPS
jgi:hypothetical protein